MKESETKNILPNIIEFAKGIGTIFLYFGLTIILAGVFSEFIGSSNSIISSLAQIGVYLILLFVLAIIYHKRLIADFKNFHKENVSIAIRNWLIGLGIMMIGNIIINSLLGGIASNEASNREQLIKYPLCNILIMVLIAPLQEEITFRASFKKAFKKEYLFCLTTAFFFGLAHVIIPFLTSHKLSELLFIIPYGALGYFLARAFYETDNIYTSFIAHAIHNGMCVALILASGAI